MAQKVIPDNEVERLLRAGLNHSQIVDLLRQKHNIIVTTKAISMWSRRRGLPRQRPATPVDLLPWRIEPQHRYKQTLTLLRTEARLRRGGEIPPRLANSFPAWKKMLADEGLVVTYIPDSEEGFYLVPREPKDGEGLVRMPEVITAASRWDEDEMVKTD